ncbi:hypothetical protein GCM10010350_83090 [Streptomyces galilaeus]|nr:hypothetical protein GCM10010350_83090 [Streptomyces galilaeus]
MPTGGLIQGSDLGSQSGCRAGRPQADGLAGAGTEQLLLGPLTDGVAAIPEQLGVSRDNIRGASRHLFGYPTEAILRANRCSLPRPRLRPARAEQAGPARRGGWQLDFLPLLKEGDSYGPVGRRRQSADVIGHLHRPDAVVASAVRQTEGYRGKAVVPVMMSL